MDYETLTKTDVKEIKDAVVESGPRDETLAALEREHAEIAARLEVGQSTSPDADRARLGEIEGHVADIRAAR
jgi:hypothetical protein